MQNSDFMRPTTHQADDRISEEIEIIRLSVEDQRRFAEAILNPPEPAPAMRRAFQRHRELFGDGSF